MSVLTHPASFLGTPPRNEAGWVSKLNFNDVSTSELNPVFPPEDRIPTMKLHIFLSAFINAVLLSSFVWAATPQPNMIVIMADDLGYNDLGCWVQGHPDPTH